MAARSGLFIFMILWSVKVSNDGVPSQMIVWNVGQGQWITVVDHLTCWHFDAGGEKAPWPSIRQHCGKLSNRFSFSHWDWDHISFVGQLKRYLPDSCILLPPNGIGSKRKSLFFEKIKSCRQDSPFKYWTDPRASNTNDQSRVFLWRQILIPGDSSKKEEKLWQAAFNRLNSVHWLILGHHGSHTSTSERLLNGLPALRGAIASARSKKYGHPHPEVRAALLRHRVPLLTTEEWGSLHIYL